MLQRNDQSEILPERRLQLHLHILSKSISCCLAERLCAQLLSSRTITEYESQVIRSQGTDLQMASQLLQVVLKKGRSACLLFYKEIESCCPQLYESVTGLPAKETKHTFRDITEVKRNNNAPTYIINISNSTLSSVIIGDHHFEHVTTSEPKPLSEDSLCHVQETMECNYNSEQKEAVQASPDQESLKSVQVSGSQLQYVIIGDHSTLQVTQEGEEIDEDHMECH
ncbi:hypothetical protein UPYG_G00150550 [Umbra pygmaea]|uniref:CARD domain-containing protein n=1 Tax=Umbra pygmaea TaxID=75934 RepID=A0ABD0WWV0_UMBPY